MEVSTQIIKTFTLTLNKEEADWLKRVMQNPLALESEDSEDYCKKMRSSFWKALGGN